jgi:phage tail sheath protein FI
MAKYKTPGVYIEEKSTIGNSVVPVPTSIPAFLGYTEQAILNGKDQTQPASQDHFPK